MHLSARSASVWESLISNFSYLESLRMRASPMVEVQNVVQRDGISQATVLHVPCSVKAGIEQVDQPSMDRETQSRTCNESGVSHSEHEKGSAARRTFRLYALGSSRNIFYKMGKN